MFLYQSKRPLMFPKPSSDVKKMLCIGSDNQSGCYNWVTTWTLSNISIVDLPTFFFPTVSLLFPKRDFWVRLKTPGTPPPPPPAPQRWGNYSFKTFNLRVIRARQRQTGHTMQWHLCLLCYRCSFRLHTFFFSFFCVIFCILYQL